MKGWIASFPDKAITVGWSAAVLKWKFCYRKFLNVNSNDAIIVLIMYLTTALVLVPLLLDMSKVYLFLSSIFTTEFENVVVCWITFGCLHVGGIYIFSNAKAKMLEAVGAIQTSLSMVVLNPKKNYRDCLFAKFR